MSQYEILEDIEEVKVGDILTIRPDLGEDLGIRYGVTSEMVEHRGEKVVVNSVKGGRSNPSIGLEDPELDDWIWHPNMFLASITKGEPPMVIEF